MSYMELIKQLRLFCLENRRHKYVFGGRREKLPSNTWRTMFLQKKIIFLKSSEDIEPVWNGKYFRKVESWNNMTMNIQKVVGKWTDWETMHSTQPQVTEDGLSRQLAEERLDQMTYTDFCNPLKTHTHTQACTGACTHSESSHRHYSRQHGLFTSRFTTLRKPFKRSLGDIKESTNSQFTLLPWNEVCLHVYSNQYMLQRAN